MTGTYPVDIEVDPPTKQSRLTVFFRGLMLIPHAFALAFIGIGVAVVTWLAFFAILITGKFPKGWLNFVVGYLHWSTRANGYGYLLTGQYPAFASGPDNSYPVRLLIEPQYEGRSRLTVFFRMFMLIPHIVAIYVIQLVAGVVYLVAWFAALFTGQVPDGMHNFLTGTLRWTTRITAYAYYVIDDYPPFSMN